MKLRETIAKVEALYLDPNNPRFLEVTDTFRAVPLDKVTDEKVQLKALERILDDRFQVSELKESILRIGFLTIDRLVVVELPIKNKYVVLEGNRRLGAIKSLLEDYSNSEIDISESVLPTLREFPVLLLEAESQERREYLARILQGVRHISGIRAWGPYQQAQVIALMIDEGRPYEEIRQTLGLSTRRINVLRRSYYALQQMNSDAEYGECTKPSLFSYFDEVFKVPQVRDWIDWDDEANKFKNTDNRRMLYGWIVGMEEEGQRFPAKIVDSKQVRDLPTLMSYPDRFRAFCQEPALSLEQIIRGIVPAGQRIDWRGILTSNVNILDQVPGVDLQVASDSDVALLEQIRDMCDRHIRMIRSYQQTGE